VNMKRLAAIVWREGVELTRDPFQLLAAFGVPTAILLVFGYGFSVDVRALRFMVLDEDRTPESRAYLEAFEHTREFRFVGMLGSPAEREGVLQAGSVRFVIEIPRGFAERLSRGQATEVGLWIEGTRPFVAETAKGFVEGAHRWFLQTWAMRSARTAMSSDPVRIETRFWYNQDLISHLTFVPALIAVSLAIFPALLTAVAVARERERGSITNLYWTPMTRLEFLIGKQVPYVVVSLVDLGIAYVVARTVFGVPFRGSASVLIVGGLAYGVATTGFGLVVSCVTRTQIAALMVTLILTIIPAFLYSGLFSPVAALGAEAKLLAILNPATYFVRIAVGTFTKGLGWADLGPSVFRLALFAIGFTGLAALRFPVQER
jgi:ribosome-dependent ATPase